MATDSRRLIPPEYDLHHHNPFSIHATQHNASQCFRLLPGALAARVDLLRRGVYLLNQVNLKPVHACVCVRVRMCTLDAHG